jgi:GNAT superfamily N-acetyltransferase
MTELRKLVPADASSIRALYLALLGGTFTNFSVQAIESYTADWTPELIADRATAGRFVMHGAFNDEAQAVGLLFGAPPEITGVGTIIWLGIGDGLRGTGLGTRLMQAAFEDYRARGCHKVKIYTETETARQFYEKLGMQVEGFHPRHWWQVDFWSLGMQL